MKYFVSATLSPQVQWQLELMIESFKSLGIEDKLFIYLAVDGTPNYLDNYSKNIKSHKNLIKHINYGRKKGFEPLNVVFSIVSALNDGIIQDEFVLLPTDCIIYKEIEEVEELENISFCKFQTDPLFTPELINKEVDLKNFDLNVSDIPSDFWPYASSVFHFKNFSIDFFNELGRISEEYVFNQIKNKLQPWNKTIQIALNIQLRKYIGKYSSLQTNEMTCNLSSNQVNNFIHYETGYYPIFNKNMFLFNPISFGNPIEILAYNAPTLAFSYTSGIAQKYLKKNKHV